MRELKAKVDGFLKKYGMDYKNISIEKECNTFIAEMKKGLEGTGGTLKMLCTYLSPEGEIPVREPVIVIDAGGTNLRVAVVTFDSKKTPVIEDFKVYPMPGTQGELTKEEFFHRIAEYLAPVIDRSSKIGFCFSYPTEILPNRDGKLIGFTKEVRVRDMNGEEIGANLLTALRAMGYDGDKRVVVLNDTVATLLGGKAAQPQRSFDSFIGFILGTGTNTCYIETNANIIKVPALVNKPGSTIINIESGGYGKAPGSVIDGYFDTMTVDPGRQLFEKMISGAYQGQLILQFLRKAAAEGLFSSEFAARVCNLNELTTTEVNDFCLQPYSEDNVLACGAKTTGCAGNIADQVVVYYIVDAVVERAAKLVAINLAAIMLKTGKGQNPCLPVCVTAEGSTFYKSKLFKGKLEYYVKEYLNDQMGLYCEFIHADKATLVGTAIAGLLN
ncbi:MAG: Hexokinase [Firmicutes bacterium]|nr:Hexokinase [Bacillota bacterium]